MPISFSGYNKLNEERNKLADETTGASGYSKATNASNALMKKMLANHLNTVPRTYGNNAFSDYMEAIQNVNPQMYDTYNAQKAIMEENLKSKNKQVGEAKERDIALNDSMQGHFQNVINQAENFARAKINEKDNKLPPQPQYNVASNLDKTLNNKVKRGEFVNENDGKFKVEDFDNLNKYNPSTNRFNKINMNLNGIQ